MSEEIVRGIVIRSQSGFFTLDTSRGEVVARLRGRLKLRRFPDGSGELIAYDRPDRPGPKTSVYRIFRTADAAALAGAYRSRYRRRGAMRMIQGLVDWLQPERHPTTTKASPRGGAFCVERSLAGASADLCPVREGMQGPVA